MKRLISVSLCVMAMLVATAHAQDFNIVGSWDVTIDSPQGQRTVVMVFKQDGGKLSGVLKLPTAERPLDSVAVKGNDVTIVMTINAQGQDLVITYKGKADTGKMSGDADFGGFATGTWSAVPHKDAAAPTTPSSGASSGTMGSGSATASADNVTGMWDVHVDTPNGPGTPTFTLKQDGEKITGTYKGQFGEAPVTGTVKGTDITITLTVMVQGQGVPVTYAGKVTGKDTMSGKATFGEYGEGAWTAKKK